MVAVCQFPERVDEIRSGDAKLFQAFLDRSRQHALTLFSEMDKNIGSGSGPFDKTILLRTIREFHRAVVTDIKLLRERADGGIDPLRQSFNGQQKLVLFRLQPDFFGQLIADVQIPADVVAKFG